jgi:monothiol glutaredoxin
MNTTKSPVFDQIRHDLSNNDVVLYMKGSPAFPQCGFSAAVVQILNHMGVKYKSVDILTDPALREGIKQFSNWPTLPQLYIKTQFIGGCDIVREMYQNGELLETFQKNGVPTSVQA